MKIEAIKQKRSGKNINFITNTNHDLDIEDAIQLASQNQIVNAKAVHTKTGKSYLRSEKNKTTTDNLENLAITCNDKDYLLFNGKTLYLKAANGRNKK